MESGVRNFHTERSAKRRRDQKVSTSSGRIAEDCYVINEAALAILLVLLLTSNNSRSRSSRASNIQRSDQHVSSRTTPRRTGSYPSVPLSSGRSAPPSRSITPPLGTDPKSTSIPPLPFWRNDQPTRSGFHTNDQIPPNDLRFHHSQTRSVKS